MWADETLVGAVLLDVDGGGGHNGGHLGGGGVGRVWEWPEKHLGVLDCFHVLIYSGEMELPCLSCSRSNRCCAPCMDVANGRRRLILSIESGGGNWKSEECSEGATFSRPGRIRDRLASWLGTEGQDKGR